MPDAPVDELIARAEDLAKGWLLALLEQAPLSDAPRVLAADLARDGPRVCEAVVRALGDDTDFRRLQAGGALHLLASRVGELTGAAGAEEVSRSVDAMRAVVWAALVQELRGPEPELVVELAERLAAVCELVRAAGLERLPEPGPPFGRSSSPLRLASREADEPPSQVAEPRAPEPADYEPPVAEPPLDYGPPVAEPPPGPEPEPEPEPHVFEPEGPAFESEAVTRPLWVGALEEEIAHTRDRGAPLSLLLVELEDAERVTAVEPPPEAGATFGEFARAVRSVARRQDILVSESEHRAWIIARDTGRAGARSLASRLTAEVARRQPWRGAALSASVGLAVLGEDGRTSEELIEAAEEARFAAAAAGLEVAEHGYEEPPPEPQD